MGGLLDEVKFDSDGYMLDPNAWTREIGIAIASQAGMTLTDRHWQVIDFARDYFTQNGNSPTPRTITKNHGISTKDLYGLFPGGPAKLVAKIAGLHKPTGCV